MLVPYGGLSITANRSWFPRLEEHWLPKTFHRMKLFIGEKPRFSPIDRSQQVIEKLISRFGCRFIILVLNIGSIWTFACRELSVFCLNMEVF